MSKESKRKNDQDIKIKIEGDDTEEKVEVKVEDTAEGHDDTSEAAETSEDTVEESAEDTAAEVEAEAKDEEAPSKKSPKSDKEESKFGADGKIHSGLFDKKKKEKKDPMKEKVMELEDRVKRQMAEFENFRKRSEKEKTQMYDMGAKSVVEKILPVIDNFERGLAGAPDDAFAEGMQMIYKQITTAFEEMGVTEIEALGKEFDPELHNAVMHVDDDSYGENEVVEVLQKGYLYHDSVVRHSMVKVAN